MKTNYCFPFYKRLLSLLALSLISFFAMAQSLILEHIAGTGASGYSGDGGPATAAQVNWVNGIAVDRYGGVYVADKGNGLVRKIDTNGIINSFAGVPAWGNGYNGDNMPATNAQLANPSGVAFDAAGNLYIADLGNSLIRKVNTSGIITSIAGNFSYIHSGDGGPATAAGFYEAYSVATDISGNIYVVEDLSNCIRMINTSGIINTIAGNSTTYGYSGDGGPATAAELARPQGVVVNAAGWAFIADYNNNRVRVIKSGIITTFAGNGTSGYTGDGGPATAAEISGPSGIWVDAGGNVYITGGGRIRMINTNGIISTAGGGGSAGDCNPATATNIAPNSVTTDASGNVYFTEVFRVAKFCAPLQVSVSNVVNVNCSGNSTGSATTTSTGGSRPYMYLWSNGQTSMAATSLSAGSYTVTVIDAYGCSVTAGTTITAPATLTANITAQVNILCNGGSNGSATVTSGGGTGSYTYSWSPLGGSGTMASNLTAGNYTVTVSDANGCTASASATISQPALLSIAASATNSSICAGNCTDINATTTGGTLPYSYVWNIGNTTTSVNVCPFSNTTYTVTVQDSNGCSSTATVSITVNALPVVTLTAANDTQCLTMTSNLLTGNPSGGIFSGPGVTGNNFDASIAGTGAQTIIYTYTDGNGCTNYDSVTIYVDVCVGVPEVSALGNKIKIYPNPNRGSLTVEMNKALMKGNYIIEVYNAIGERMYHNQFTNHNSMITLDLSDLSEGVYTLQVKTERGVINKRLVKIN